MATGNTVRSERREAQTLSGSAPLVVRDCVLLGYSPVFSNGAVATNQHRRATCQQQGEGRRSDPERERGTGDCEEPLIWSCRNWFGEPVPVVLIAGYSAGVNADSCDRGAVAVALARLERWQGAGALKLGADRERSVPFRAGCLVWEGADQILDLTLPISQLVA